MDIKFYQALDKFLRYLDRMNEKETARLWPGLAPEKHYANIDLKSKYIRVTQGASAFCFIVREDNETKKLGKVKCGDILKAETYKSPAKHVRGTIFTDDPEQYGCTIFGAKYLR